MQEKRIPALGSLLVGINRYKKLTGGFYEME